MDSVKSFMTEYFASRFAEEQRHQANREPFRRRFFESGCSFDSHESELEMIKSEKIIAIEGDDMESDAITDAVYPGAKSRIRLRYRLRRRTDQWVIRAVQIGCVLCEGGVSSSCPCCKGQYWIGGDTTA
jgi:hypothetical protein